MKNVTKLVGLSALAVVALASLGSASADFSEKGSRGEHGERPEPTAEQQAEMEAHKTAVEEAVKNNDFEAFEALRAEHKTEREVTMQERSENSERPDKPEREELTDLEKQEKFDELVAYYNENGELPKKEMKKKGKRKGTLNDGQKGKVRAVLSNIDNPEKVQKILTRIDDKILSIESSDLDDTRKDEILGLLEGIKELFQESLDS